MYQQVLQNTVSVASNIYRFVQGRTTRAPSSLETAAFNTHIQGVCKKFRALSYLSIMVTRKRPIKRSAVLAALDKVDENQNEDGVTQPKVPKELLVIAQEVKIVRALACNDLTKRNRQIRKLRKWFQLRAVSSFPFTEDDFMRIWKGLYYNVWMSDKPLVQEELAEQLAQMVDSFSGNTACSIAYFSAFMRTMCQEWFGIDQWRMDKFLMLVRRMLRYMLRLLKQSKWSPDLIQTFNTSMQQSVLAEQPKSRGITMHYMDVFFEELAKAANEDITADEVNLLLRPFVHYVGTQRDPKLVAHCRTRVLYHLLYQSALGREYSEKYRAWKEMGFPSASIDDVEKLDSGFDEEEDEPEDQQQETQSLDPRAGNVDVLMPELPFNADCVLDELQTLLRTQEYSSKRRKGLRKLVQIFETYAAGEFPLGVRNMPKPDGIKLSELVEQKIADADEFEESNFGTGRNLKKLSKSKRKRLLKSINFDEVTEENFDEIIGKALSPKMQKQIKRNAKVRSSINNAWVVEDVAENETALNQESKPAKRAKKTVVGKEEEPKQSKKQLGQQLKEEQSNEQQQQSKEKHSKEKPLKERQPKEKQVKEQQLKEQQIKEQQLKEKQPKEQPLKEKQTKEQQPKEQQPKEQQPKEQQPKEQQQAKEKQSKEQPTAAAEPTNAATDDAINKPSNGWKEPLQPGEEEFFVAARKVQVKQANNKLLANAAATPKNIAQRLKHAAPQTDSGSKRVRIVTKANSAYPKSDYYRQLKLSPQVPYDANRQPGKSALKPHVLPGPINPNYKKAKRLFNDTL